MTAVQIPTRTKWLKNKLSMPNQKVVLKEDKPRRVTPSVYAQELLQSTEERLANTNEMHPPRILELLDMSKTTHHKSSLVDVDQALFQPYPSELVFQNFSPAQAYKLPLLLLNNDKVSRQVKLEVEDSEYFHVVGPEDACSKVAPGMSSTFTVFFTPQDNKDYHHKLVCVTERERFEVPVRAIGPRAILDFQDEFHLPVCAVKATTQKTYLVRNIGNSKATFKLRTKKPFSVTPTSGTLEVGESLQVTVDFHPMTIGVHTQDLLLHYHTGEDVHISLCGTCEKLNIHLKPDSLLLKKTYISLSSISTVSLTNTSQIPLKYCWSAWSSQEEKDWSLLRDSSVLQQKEKERLLIQRDSDPSAMQRITVLSKALQDRRGHTARDHLLDPPHSCITVEPVEGEIWPNVTVQFNIVFKPEEAMLYEQTLYCDVTETVKKLFTNTYGYVCIGPKLQLNYNLMDMKNVFIGDKDCYEVLLTNSGLIDAPFSLSSPDTTFGRCFSFHPEEGVVPSGACQIVEVTFHSHVLGTFSEDLGCVIGPTFHFNVSELNFGDVAFGFPLTLPCTLFNTSFVPMKFALRVVGDGLGSPSVTSVKQVSEISRNNWQSVAAKDPLARPVEFTVSPAEGSVRAMSDITIQVTLCSNTVKRYRLALVVDVEGVGNDIISLPINARCVVPEIVVETPLLDFQRCFLNYPYQQQVRLTNPSSLPACYGVLDQEYEESPALLFGSFVPRGVILPYSSEEITLFLLAKAVGRLHQSLQIAVFGSLQPPLEVVLSCIGQGPVVHIQSPQVEFGKIPVLTDIIKTLHLSNQSPIPAKFTACMSKGRSFYRVEPSEGQVAPESLLELKVVAHLKDTLLFQDRLEVSIQDSQTYTVLLSATGTGTTIVSDKPFAPSLDLGAHFSNGPCQYHFKLTNHGQRVHRLYWGTDGFLPSTRTSKDNFSGRTILPAISSPRQKGALGVGSSLSSCRKKPVFSLTPSRVELFPGCSVDMVLTGISDSSKVVRERLVCRGIVGHKGCCEQIMSVDVVCRFVAPVLSISPKQLNFYKEKVPGTSLMPLYEKLVLKNVSSLSLSMELSLVEPFFLCDGPGAHDSSYFKSILLGDGRQTELWVCFNPSYIQDRVSRIIDEVLEVNYQGHPQQDTVNLHAEVCFPNLHFSSTAVDFGCVLNSTENHREITITNCSPLPVSYHWDFLEDQKHFSIRETERLEEETESEEGSRELGPLHVEEVFDILPIHGLLQPGDQQVVSFSFYGHENISREVVAQCHVEEGPTYEIKLRGEASAISYTLDITHIDFGLQLFDHVGEAEVTLRNTGRVGFKFGIIHLQRDKDNEGDDDGRAQKNGLEKEKQISSNEGEVVPGQLTVIPSTGYIDAGAEQCLRVLYLPGIPEVFEKQFQLQVAFLPPHDITVIGEGVFPRISLNLPQNLSEECYSEVLQQARAAVEADIVREELMNGINSGGQATTETSCCTHTYEELLHMEIERILVKKNALAVTGSLLELRDSEGSSKMWHKLSKFLLPEYVLDFGHVAPIKVPSHTVHITNCGAVPVSLHANRKALAGTGFSAEFERVKSLPCGETQTFTVKFDPQGAKEQRDAISVLMPIQVAGGPMVQVRLCAVVAMPAITVSTEILQFDAVLCGMCQIKAIQLLNHESVPCHWSITEEAKPPKRYNRYKFVLALTQVDKFLPYYQRKKLLKEQQPPPAVFEMIPSSGILSPGERVNIQIKFSPTHGHFYKRQLVVHVVESTQQVFITAQGQGEEPQLEFCPSVLELGPCLPSSTEIEAEVMVKNPCSFPIEFYSLEFDKQYIEEEKILHLMQDYDENNILLLPPRGPGESLPTELLDYYKEYCSHLKDDAKEVGLNKEEGDKDDTQEGKTWSKQNSGPLQDSKKEELPSIKLLELFNTEMFKKGSSERLGQLELTPVSKAIARHIGLDLSPESLAARNRRGIAIIVYGALQTGISPRAAALAQYYGGACLSVDAVVTDVLLNGSSPVSLAARQLYAEYTEKKVQEAAQALEDTTDLEPATDSTPSDPASNSDPVSLNVEVLKKSSDDNRNNCKEGDVTTISSLLPEGLLSEILAERFQSSDCYCGVVIDGLDSVYTQSVTSTLQVVLKAFNNRKHIYVVHLCDSSASQRQTEDALQKEKTDGEEQWLQEMDEEVYESLPEEQKERIIERHRENLRQQKLSELKRMSEEQEEKKQQEEMKTLKHDDLKKKNKKGGKKETKEAPRKKSLLDGKQVYSADRANGQTSSCDNSKETSMDAREQLILNAGHCSKEPEDSQKQTDVLHTVSPQPRDKMERKKPIIAVDEYADISNKTTEEGRELYPESPIPADKMEGEMSSVDETGSRFTAYEQIQEQVEKILHCWDRAQGLLLVPRPTEKTPQVTDDAPTSTEKLSPVAKKSTKATSKALSPTASQMAAPEDADKEEDRASTQDVIPHIVLNVTVKDCPSVAELLKGSPLPEVDKVLDDLGLGPSGPPLPPAMTFSMFPFPQNRKQYSSQLTCDCFTFLVMEESEATASRSHSKGSIKENAVTKDKKAKENQKNKSRATVKTKAKGFDQGHSPLHITTISDINEQDQHQANLELKRNQSLTTFRWVVPAKGFVLLKIWFYSESAGKFEQTFNFELLGTQRHYKLVCKGVCTYPSICKDYKTIFALSKHVPQMEEGLKKMYIVKLGYFEFGPLLCSKTRDRYKENRYPENTERLVIHNNTGLEAEVHFRFQHDTQATTYLLNPPTMTLNPNQKQELTVWAYPTKPGQIRDSVVCYIKDNPERVFINISCWGVRPELELESKQLQFERWENRSVTLHNKTALPVSWRLQGLEELGDEFSVPQDQGIISPNSSFCLSLHFRARRPLKIKKTLRLEVSDVEKILGIVSTENIQVTAEAYDIALDITPDGCLDFGTIKVFEETKLSLRIKNQGKYEIAYKFIFEQRDPAQPKLDSIFTISPQQGSLMPHEKPTTVQIVCRPNVEVLIRKEPVLSCQVIEPSLGNGGEIIAIIAIKMSVQSVFSRYKITPACDINFGPLVYGSKKSHSFTIENNGFFETRFTICMITDHTLQAKQGCPSKKTPRENHSVMPTGISSKLRRESFHKDATIVQNRLTMGVFSVSPSTGSLQPGSHQVVIVDCVAEQLGNWNHGLLIDISDRDPLDHPEGIPYRLMAEVCKPGIALDMASIFEEHFLCPSSIQLSSEQFSSADGIYLLDENKFIFNKVLVGQTAQARFKFTNTSKVSCVLNLAIKYVGSKVSRNIEVFDVPAATLTIPSQSHSYAVATFTPQTMQLYNAVFEATVEGANRMTPTFRTKVLEFELMGEGSLPSVCVVRPALRDNRGSPVLQFRRVLVGRRQTLALVLLNDGSFPAQVQLDMLDKHGVFTLKAAPGNTCSSIYSKELDGTSDSEHQSVHRAVLRLNSNEQVEFEVSFCSDKPLTVKATMSLQVQDNQYSNTIIQVTGEAYQEIVSLDNINRSSEEQTQEDEESGYYEVLNFGDCHVDCPYQRSFTITNHSSSQVVRFEWPPAGPHLTVLPQVGHLHAGCSKEVTVTFSSNRPVTLHSQPMRCKIYQVEFQHPVEQVADWDDRQRTAQRQSGPQQTSGTQPPQPVKNKLIKADPEPSHSVVEGSQWELELRVSAICDYVKFSCNSDAVQFKDTMLYQSRIHQLQIVNQSAVKLEFSWQVLVDSSKNMANVLEEGTFTSQPGSQSEVTLAAEHPPSAVAGGMSGMGDPQLPPFSVEPSIGAINPGATQKFNVHFSPLEVAQFQGRLFCSIPNVQDGDQCPSIAVCGRSLLPHCHFDLEESDYISGKSRNHEFKGSLDPETKVLEFTAVGLSAPTRRCFTVLNPTTDLYSFTWKCKDKGGSQFNCLTQCGTILPGKRVEMCFEYVAEHLDVVESSWNFVIESLSLSVPLLCVGHTREPLVYLNRPYLDLGELLVVEQTVDLVNGESEPFRFSVVESSLLCEDQQSSLILQPMTGHVAAKNRSLASHGCHLSLSFTPCREGFVNFKLVLRVKRKSELLTLSVKADCFSMSTLVRVENPDGGFRDVKPTHQETLDFGKVVISEQSTFNFVVSSLARFSLVVNFEITGPSELLHHLEAKPQHAVIEVGKQLQSSLFFHPQSICKLQDVRLSIKVKHGPTFTFAIQGRSIAPSLEFSFTKFNFGKCFLHCPGMVPPSKTLVISNKGELQEHLLPEMNFHPDILSPGAVMEVPLTFYPCEADRYHEKLTFILNSCVRKKVDILGRGIEMKLEVENPKHRKVKLGSLMLGQKVKKQVVIVNRSPLDVSFNLVLNTNLPLDPKDLKISPVGNLSLKANGGSSNVEIQFSPSHHISPFTAELQAQFAGLLHPLLTIQGCCQGVAVMLDQDHLAFGAVVQRCQAKKRIVMRNKGDLGARFQWKTKSFPPQLTIAPDKGYIGPGTEVPLEVTFVPEELSNDIRYENLSCFVEGSSSSISLTVTGSCIVASTGKEVVHFVCPVRGSHTQTLPVFNPTMQRCSIRPVIEGEQWSAAPSLTLEPHQNKTYEITYRPLTMTVDGKKHLGSVFFSFPDGTGTQHTELLPVHNWLSKQQRFHVLMEILKPDKPDATVSLKGLEYIDVPALAKRAYKVSFFTFREGQYNTKVIFNNEKTGEYLFYLITFKATSPGVLSTIELVTTVRRTISATVQVENPLTTSICLTTECKCADISAPHQHVVPGQSKGSLSFEYQPQRAGESTARLTLFSNELGYFLYDLLLKALPPPPEKTVHFSASLGGSHSVLVKFISYSHSKTEYSCETDSPDFIVEKSVSVSPGFQAGTEASVDVCFEPQQLGEVRAQLSLSSGIGGEYVFPLNGICLPPKAQGPFSVRAGRNITIPFKNVFLQTTTFSFQVDNPCFTIKGLDTMLSKKTQNILVSFESPADGSAGPWFGKMTVSTQSTEGHSKPWSWVYYLKGHRSES
ncbi:hypothetical protein Q5P01_012089 [Channa striata]|uniref:Hydrocephalus-inducing protein homolog n=1 Tax=Channa striata TaxID=64152 RepID=A0AA88MRQ9_CHASR|nr:hypothetical protein Q5P01_012089 [Channa striata]